MPLGFSHRQSAFARGMYTFSPPDRGSMHPYSSETTSPQAAKRVPTVQTTKANPTLPVDLTMDPGVAKIPLPITRDTTKM